MGSRSRLIAIGVVAVVVIAGIAALAISRLATPSSPAFALVDETTLVVLRGSVQLTRGSSTSTVTPGSDSIVRPGDRIRTSADSYASLTYFDGSTTEIEPGTDLTITTLDRRPDGGAVISFRQEIGLTWNRVERLLDANSRFEVTTSSAVAYVRGTEFKVLVTTEQQTIVEAVTDPVVVESAGASVTVQPGFQTTVNRGQPPAAPVPAPPARFGVRLELTGPVRVFVTDNVGRSVGFHPNNDSYGSQIPGASYGAGPTQRLVIPNPVASYEVVLNPQGSGPYSLVVTALSNGQPVGMGASHLARPLLAERIEGTSTSGQRLGTGFDFRDGQVQNLRRPVVSTALPFGSRMVFARASQSQAPQPSATTQAVAEAPSLAATSAPPGGTSPAATTTSPSPIATGTVSSSPSPSPLRTLTPTRLPGTGTPVATTTRSPTPTTLVVLGGGQETVPTAPPPPSPVIPVPPTSNGEPPVVTPTASTTPEAGTPTTGPGQLTASPTGIGIGTATPTLTPPGTITVTPETGAPSPTLVTTVTTETGPEVTLTPMPTQRIITGGAPAAIALGTIIVTPAPVPTFPTAPPLSTVTVGPQPTIPVGASCASGIPPVGGSPALTSYNVTDNIQSPELSFNWIDISQTGAVLATLSNVDDVCGGPVTLPFAFPFFGELHNQVFINSNGMLNFGNGSTSFSNVAIPSSSLPNNYVAPFWDDIDSRCRTNDGIFVQSFESYVAFQWLNWNHFNCPFLATPSTYTFEVQLHEDGSILFQYLTMSDQGSATVGIENQNGTSGFSYTGSLVGGGAVKLSPLAGPPLATATGTVVIPTVSSTPTRTATATSTRTPTSSATPTATRTSTPTATATGVVASASVFAWGRNAQSQLGDGTSIVRTTPITVSGLTGITSLSAGSAYGLAAKSDGTVFAWGFNNFGQLGDGTTSIQPTPFQIPGLSGVVDVAAGDAHSLAAKSDGLVMAWGRGNSGELGDGGQTQRLTPVPVTSLTGVVAVAAGSQHSLALKADGTVWAWGRNNEGQLGDGTVNLRTAPVQVTGLGNAIAIAAEFNQSYALKSDGTVVAWGLNSSGQLGDGTTTNRFTPVQVSGLAGVVEIAVGRLHNLALMSDGTVAAWGRNQVGQLGDGTTTDRLTPVPVTGLSNVHSVGAGVNHSLAVLNDGTARSWGSNSDGELGDPSVSVSRLTPGPVIGLSGVVFVDGGNSYSLAR